MGNNIFSKSCVFKIGATKTEHFPSDKFYEFAFIGRSNVGKSSLLNSLVNRNKLAKTSQNPGRTQQINFFLLGDLFYLVDLPGYGYANASKVDMKKWNSLSRFYLSNQNQLHRVFLLVDSRHGLKSSDIEMLNFLISCMVSVQIVLTKVDKINRDKRIKVVESVKELLDHHPSCSPQIICCSSHTKEGMDCLRNSMLDSMGFLSNS